MMAVASSKKGRSAFSFLPIDDIPSQIQKRVEEIIENGGSSLSSLLARYRIGEVDTMEKVAAHVMRETSLVPVLTENILQKFRAALRTADDQHKSCWQCAERIQKVWLQNEAVNTTPLVQEVPDSSSSQPSQVMEIETSLAMLSTRVRKRMVAAAFVDSSAAVAVSHVAGFRKLVELIASVLGAERYRCVDGKEIFEQDLEKLASESYQQTGKDCNIHFTETGLILFPTDRCTEVEIADSSSAKASGRWKGKVLSSIFSLLIHPETALEQITLLLVSTSSLRRLIWIGKSLKEKEAKKLFDSFQHVPHLMRLTLDMADLSLEGLKWLCLGLPKVSHLRVLSLCGNGIDAEGAKCLAEGLSHVPHMMLLDLQENKLNSVAMKHLSRSFHYISELKILNLGQNLLDSEAAVYLADGLLHTPQLQLLNIWGNDIGDRGGMAIANVVPYVPHLTKLKIGFNSFVPPFAVTVKKIETLRAFGGYHERQPSIDFVRRRGPPVSELNLSHLQLSDEEAATLPWEEIATHCTFIDLSHNRFTALPGGIQFLSPTQCTGGIRLEGNPLAGLSLQTWIRYEQKELLLSDLIASVALMYGDDQVRCREIKIMVVGKGAVGKTTLLKRLSGCTNRAQLGRNQATDGVDLSLGKFELGGLCFHSWDFGGQYVYRYTHQLFLTDNSIYLLLFDLRHQGKTVREEVFFWCRSVRARAPHAPMALVGTHASFLQAEMAKRRLEAMGLAITRNFGAETLSFQVAVDSLRGGSGIKILRERLVACGQRHRRFFPKCVSFARQYIRSLAEQRRAHGLPLACDYEEALQCLSSIVPSHQEAALQAVESLGEIITVDYPAAASTPLKISSSSDVARKTKKKKKKKKKKKLTSSAKRSNVKETGDQEKSEEDQNLSLISSRVRHAKRSRLVILDPQWLANLMATVVTIKQSHVRGGVLPHSAFIRMWAQYDAHLHAGLLSLLQRCDILFPVGPEQSLIPCLLSEREPPLAFSWDLCHHAFLLHRRYRMRFVPFALVGRMMAFLLPDSDDVLECWRDGCVVDLTQSWHEKNKDASSWGGHRLRVLLRAVSGQRKKSRKRKCKPAQRKGKSPAPMHLNFSFAVDGNKLDKKEGDGEVSHIWEECVHEEEEFGFYETDSDMEEDEGSEKGWPGNENANQETEEQLQSDPFEKRSTTEERMEILRFQKMDRRQLEKEASLPSLTSSVREDQTLYPREQRAGTGGSVSAMASSLRRSLMGSSMTFSKRSRRSKRSSRHPEREAAKRRAEDAYQQRVREAADFESYLEIKIMVYSASAMPLAASVLRRLHEGLKNLMGLRKFFHLEYRTTVPCRQSTCENEFPWSQIESELAEASSVTEESESSQDGKPKGYGQTPWHEREVTCSACQGAQPIRMLAPDLLMADLGKQLEIDSAQLREIRVLGQGAFGKVYLAAWSTDLKEGESHQSHEQSSAKPWRLDEEKIVEEEGGHEMDTPKGERYKKEVEQEGKDGWEKLVAVKETIWDENRVATSLDLSGIWEECETVQVLATSNHKTNQPPEWEVLLAKYSTPEKKDQKVVIYSQMTVDDATELDISLEDQTSDFSSEEGRGHSVSNPLSLTHGALTTDSSLPRSRMSVTRQMAKLQILREFQWEVSLMSEVVHPNIVRLYGFCAPPRMAIVMEMMAGGDLSQIRDPLRLGIAKHAHFYISQVRSLMGKRVLSREAFGEAGIPEFKFIGRFHWLKLKEAADQVQRRGYGALFYQDLRNSLKCFRGAARNCWHCEGDYHVHRQADEIVDQMHDQLLEMDKKYASRLFCWDWIRKLKICLDIARGLAHIHGLQPAIVHFDLKPENVMLATSLQNLKVGDAYLRWAGEPLAKLADFGLSNRLHALERKDQQRGRQMGTLMYMAPEVLMEDGSYGPAADIYALALLMWEIATRKEIFEGIHMQHMAGAILAGERPSLGSLPSDTPKAFALLIQQCWSGVEEHRPSAPDVVFWLEKLFQQALSAHQETEADGDLEGQKNMPTLMSGDVVEKKARLFAAWEKPKDGNALLDASNSKMEESLVFLKRKWFSLGRNGSGEGGKREASATKELPLSHSSQDIEEAWQPGLELTLSEIPGWDRKEEKLGKWHKPTQLIFDGHRYIWVGFEDGSICVCDIRRGWQCVRRTDPLYHQHQGRVEALLYQKETSLAWSAGADGQICVWFGQRRDVLATLDTVRCDGELRIYKGGRWKPRICSVCAGRFSVYKPNGSLVWDIPIHAGLSLERLGQAEIRMTWSLEDHSMSLEERKNGLRIRHASTEQMQRWYRILQYVRVLSIGAAGFIRPSRSHRARVKPHRVEEGPVGFSPGGKRDDVRIQVAEQGSVSQRRKQKSMSGKVGILCCPLTRQLGSEAHPVRILSLSELGCGYVWSLTSSGFLYAWQLSRELGTEVMCLQCVRQINLPWVQETPLSICALKVSPREAWISCGAKFIAVSIRADGKETPDAEVDRLEDSSEKEVVPEANSESPSPPSVLSKRDRAMQMLVEMGSRQVKQGGRLAGKLVSSKMGMKKLEFRFPPSLIASCQNSKTKGETSSATLAAGATGIGLGSIEAATLIEGKEASSCRGVFVCTVHGDGHVLVWDRHTRTVIAWTRSLKKGEQEGYCSFTGVSFVKTRQELWCGTNEGQILRYAIVRDAGQPIQIKWKGWLDSPHQGPIISLIWDSLLSNIHSSKKFYVICGSQDVHHVFSIWSC